MSEVKISIRINAWEINYEGSEEFLKSDLRSVLDNLFESKIWENRFLDYTNPDNSAIQNSTDTEIGIERKQYEITMSSLCAKLACETGADLVLAACAHLTLVDGLEYLERREILNRMKDASRYYKESFGSNLSKYFQTLVKQGKLIERKNDVYFLTPNALDEMEVAIAST